MGILLEADYKGVLTGKESIWGGLSRAFSSSKMGGSGDLRSRKEGEEIKPGERDGQFTYELMNRDSGMSLSPYIMVLVNIIWNKSLTRVM